MAKLTLSLGSNVGDRDQYLLAAREELEDRVGHVLYASEIVTTAPWGRSEQENFRNQVLVLAVDLDGNATTLPDRLHEILDTTQEIEHGLGRKRDLHWGPRTLDIDLIFVDDLIYEDNRLSLPHPWWWHRPFVRDLLPAGLLDPYGRILDS